MDDGHLFASESIDAPALTALLQQHQTRSYRFLSMAALVGIMSGSQISQSCFTGVSDPSTEMKSHKKALS